MAKADFGDDDGRQPLTLELARFAAAMQELKDNHEAFDALVPGNSEAHR